MRPYIRQELIAKLAMRGEHGVRLTALDQIPQKTRIVRGPKETLQDKNIRRIAGKLGRPGMIATERCGYGHFPATLDELGQQVKVEFVRPAHSQPRDYE